MKGKGEVKQNAHKYGQEEGRVSLYCSNNLKSCEYGMLQEMMTAESTCTDTQTSDCTVYQFYKTYSNGGNLHL